MAFVGEIQHLRRYAFHLQRREELEAFAYVEAVIPLPVNHQRRRLEVLRVLMRRKFLIQRAIVVRRAFELPVIEPEFFSRAPGRLGVEHAIVRHDALEAVCVPENPVGHVSAIAGAERALAVLVDERIMLLGVLEALHQVFKRSAAPIAIDGVDELLPVSGRAMEVDFDDDISLVTRTWRREQFGIPAVAPLVAGRNFWPAVHDKLQWIFLAGIEVRRLDQEALDLVAVRTGEPERFERRHRNLRKYRVVEMGQLEWFWMGVLWERF